jgi:hypothetical protein
MPRGRKRKNRDLKETEEIEEKVAKIGEFATPKEEIPEEEIPEKIQEEEIPEEEIPTIEEEAPKEKSPEDIKEYWINLFLTFATYGLPETEKESFEKTFRYFNGAIFDVLNLGNNLEVAFKRIKEKFNLSPEKAFMIYLFGTIALIVILRPDLRQKIFGKKGKIEEQKPPETPPPPKEEKVEEKPESK